MTAHQRDRYKSHTHISQEMLAEAVVDGDVAVIADAQRALADAIYESDLDLRTTEEIEDDAEAEARAARVFVTGYPARPGTVR